VPPSSSLQFDRMSRPRPILTRHLRSPKPSMLPIHVVHFPNGSFFRLVKQAPKMSFSHFVGLAGAFLGFFLRSGPLFEAFQKFFEPLFPRDDLVPFDLRVVSFCSCPSHVLLLFDPPPQWTSLIPEPIPLTSFST